VLNKTSGKCSVKAPNKDRYPWVFSACSHCQLSHIVSYRTLSDPHFVDSGVSWTEFSLNIVICNF